MAKTLNPIILIADGTSNAAGAVTRATITLDVNNGGGFITGKITNGATGPTAQATFKVSRSLAATLPAAGAIGAVWGLVAQYGGGVTASDVREWTVPFGPGEIHLQVEIANNTGFAVTGRALLSQFTFT